MGKKKKKKPHVAQICDPETVACCYEARLRFVCPRRLTKIKTAKVHILDSCIITYHTKNYINVCNFINVNFPITGYFYNKWLRGVVVKKFERVETQTQSPVSVLRICAGPKPGKMGGLCQ